MTGIALTSHAEKRLQQRGMRIADVKLIMQYGTEVADGYLLRRKDVAKAMSNLKKVMTRLEHLEGRVVIEEDQHVITAYKTCRKKQRRLLSKTQ